MPMYLSLVHSVICFYAQFAHFQLVSQFVSATSLLPTFLQSLMAEVLKIFTVPSLHCQATKVIVDWHSWEPLQDQERSLVIFSNIFEDDFIIF